MSYPPSGPNLFMSNHRTMILTFAATIIFIIAFFPVFKTLVNQWSNSENYAHAFLTVPIIAYMVWRKCQTLKEMRSDGSPFGFTIALISVLVYLIALHARISSLASVSMVVTLFGVVAYVHGFSTVKLLGIPFILLLLLIPIPGTIYSATTLPLQLKVSQVSEIIIRLFDIPILREGNVLIIPEKTFQIVQACSGMRSIITLLSLSLIIGYFTLIETWLKLVLAFISIPVAMFVNTIRVVVMILAFYFYRVDLSAGASHTLVGVGIFIFSLVMLFSIQRVIDRWEARYRKS